MHACMRACLSSSQLTLPDSSSCHTDWPADCMTDPRLMQEDMYKVVKFVTSIVATRALPELLHKAIRYMPYVRSLPQVSPYLCMCYLPFVLCSIQAPPLLLLQSLLTVLIDL